MSKTTIKAEINANIKQNGTGAITGNVLNSVLNDMVDDYATQEEVTALSSKVNGILHPYSLIGENGDISTSTGEDGGIYPHRWRTPMGAGVKSITIGDGADEDFLIYRIFVYNIDKSFIKYADVNSKSFVVPEEYRGFNVRFTFKTDSPQNPITARDLDFVVAETQNTEDLSMKIGEMESVVFSDNLSNYPIAFGVGDYSIETGEFTSPYKHRRFTNLISNIKQILVVPSEQGANASLSIRKILKYRKDGQFVSGRAVNSSVFTIYDGDVYDYRIVFGTSPTSYDMSYGTYDSYLHAFVNKKNYPSNVNRLDFNSAQRVTNSNVESYWLNVHYIEGDFSKSYIHNFVAMPIGIGHLDWSEGVILSFDNLRDFNGSVKVYTNPAKDGIVSEEPVINGVARIYNLIPNNLYWYEIVDGSGYAYCIGTIQTTGCRRFINLNGGYNVRDFGGLRTLTGYTTIYGKIYRGSELDNTTDEDKNLLLNTLKVSAELDFRTDSESSSSSSSVLGDDVKYQRIAQGGFPHPLSDNTAAANAIKQIAEWLAQDEVIYMHCVGGADRTGFIAFILGALIGVPESTLAKDYELTSFSSYGLREITDSTQYYYAYGVSRIRNLEGSTLQIKVVNWLKDLGVTENEILTIQNKLLVE